MTLDHADLREALLAAEISREVSTHLERCPDCASLARDLQAIDALAPSLEAELALPPGLIEKTLARIADNRDARTPYVDHVDVREALLAAETSRAVSAHLEHCPDCASLALDLQAIDALAPSLEAELVLPPGLIEKTLARIADNRDALLPQFGTATVRALSPPRRRAPRGERLNASRLNRWLLFGGIAAALLMFCIGIGAGMVPWNALRVVQKVQPGATITSSEAAARAHPPQLRVDVDALATALRHRADLFSSPIHLHGVDLGGAD